MTATTPPLRYTAVKIGPTGACLDMLCLASCKDAGCTYKHPVARVTIDLARAAAAATKLKTGYAAYIARHGGCQTPGERELLWPKLASARNVKTTCTTLLSPVTTHPTVRRPQNGLPISARASARTKVAGGRVHDSHKRSEEDRIWRTLVKKILEQQAPAKQLQSILKFGKRPRPGPAALAAAPARLDEWLTKGNNAQRGVQQPGVRQGHETAPMTVAQGKQKKLMSPSACVNFHPFTETLCQWEEGVSVDCGGNWTRDQVDAAIQQGPHTLALTPEAIDLIEEDVAYQVQWGYAEIVEWEWLQHRIPAQLKVSPLAVVPQKNR
jgi:hypothetical protein